VRDGNGEGESSEIRVLFFEPQQRGFSKSKTSFSPLV